MSEQGKPKKMRRDFGEFLESKEKTADGKPTYYIKVTAKDTVLDMIREGTIIELEAPKEKYERMIASGKLTDKQAEDCKTSLGKIPKFFVKRLVAKI